MLRRGWCFLVGSVSGHLLGLYRGPTSQGSAVRPRSLGLYRGPTSQGSAVRPRCMVRAFVPDPPLGFECSRAAAEPGPPTQGPTLARRMRKSKPRPSIRGRGRSRPRRMLDWFVYSARFKNESKSPELHAVPIPSGSPRLNTEVGDQRMRRRPRPRAAPWPSAPAGSSLAPPPCQASARLA